MSHEQGEMLGGVQRQLWAPAEGYTGSWRRSTADGDEEPPGEEAASIKRGQQG